MVARSTSSSGSADASPTIQRTPPAPGLPRATSTDARAGSNPGYVEALARQQNPEGAGTATDVEHARRPELTRDREVRVQVAAVGVEGDVDGREPGILERPIRHDATIRSSGQRREVPDARGASGSR